VRHLRSSAVFLAKYRAQESLDSLELPLSLVCAHVRHHYLLVCVFCHRMELLHVYVGCGTYSCTVELSLKNPY